MRSSGVAIAFSLLAAGCTNTSVVEEIADGQVGMDDMSAYCIEKAAALFTVEAKDIDLAPVDRAGGIYTLRGKYPPDAAKPETFQCQFDPEGKFISVVPT